MGWRSTSLASQMITCRPLSKVKTSISSVPGTVYLNMLVRFWHHGALPFIWPFLQKKTGPSTSWGHSTKTMKLQNLGLKTASSTRCKRKIAMRFIRKLQLSKFQTAFHHLCHAITPPQFGSISAALPLSPFLGFLKTVEMWVFRCFFFLVEDREIKIQRFFSRQTLKLGPSRS